MAALQWQWSGNAHPCQVLEIEFAASNAKIGQGLNAGVGFWCWIAGQLDSLSPCLLLSSGGAAMIAALRWQWSSGARPCQALEIDFAASNAEIGQELNAGVGFW